MRLPIFATGKDTNNGEVLSFKYVDTDNTYDVEIRNGSLTALHRKIFLCVEYLYLKQNPTFNKKFVRTSFKELTNELSLKGNNHKLLLEALLDLQRVNIKSLIKVKTQEAIVDKGISFNLFANIIWNYNHPVDKVINTSKRAYTNSIDIKLADFHINNLKNKYFRLINYQLAKQLKPNTLRLFDYLNLHSHYKGKNSSYTQKQNLILHYDDLISYLLLKNRPNHSWRQRQFTKQLDELKFFGVVKSYTFDTNLFNETTIVLQLAKSINLWSKYNPRINENIPKYTPLQNKLKERSIPNKQIIYLTNNYSEEFITDKIEQFDYVMKFLPYKIKGKGSYLYNSIKDDWIDDKYITHKEDLKQKDLNLFSQKFSNKIQKKKEEYIVFCRDKCLNYWNTIDEEERQEIDKLIMKEIEEHNFLHKTKSLSKFSYTAKKIEILHKIVILPTFDEWEKQQI